MNDAVYEEDGFFETIWGKIFLFVNPFLIAALFIYLLYLIVIPSKAFGIVAGGISAYFFPPFGKESVIPLVVSELTRQNFYTPLATITLVAGTIAYVDVITSYFLLWNLYIVEKIPVLGDWMRKFRDFGAQTMKEKSWIKKVAFVGVALFVMVPFQGSGGVGASILGRVIGMNKYQAWMAIIVGSFSGCFLIATLSHYLGSMVIDIFESSMVQGIGTLAVLGIIFIILYTFFKHRKKMEVEGSD